MAEQGKAAQLPFEGGRRCLATFLKNLATCRLLQFPRTVGHNTHKRIVFAASSIKKPLSALVVETPESFWSNMDLTEDTIIRSVMGYLRSCDLYDSLCMLKLETGVSEEALEPELTYLQGLILEGKWDDVIAYVEPLQQYVPDYNQHQYLEALSWQGMGGAPPNVLPWRPLKHSSQQSNADADADIDMEVVIKILKTLEPITNKQEFNDLCHYLTLPRLSDHPNFSNWSISRGRIECFEHLHNLLRDIVPRSQEDAPAILDLRRALSSNPEQVVARPSSAALPASVPSSRPTTSQSKQITTNLPPPPVPKQPTPPSRVPVAWTVDVEAAPVISTNGANNPRQRQGEIIHIPNDIPSKLETRDRISAEEVHEPRSVLSKGAKSGVSFSDACDAESQHTTTSASTKFTKLSQQMPSQVPRNTLGLSPATKSHPMPLYRWESGASVEDTHIRPQTILTGNCPLRAVEVCKPLLPTERDVEKGVLLAIGSNNKTMHIMSVDGKNSAVSNVTDVHDIHRGSVYTCDWSLLSRNSSECLLASGSNDKFVRICSPLETSSDGAASVVKASLKGHSGTVRVVKFSRAKDSTQLASGGAGDCVVRLWDVETGACTMLSKHENHIHGLSWFDSQVIISGCDSGTLIGHDIRAPNAAWVLNLSSNGICSLSRINRNYILVGHTNGEVSLLHATEQRKLCSYSLHSGDVRSVALWDENALMGSDHALFALTTSYDGYGCVWKLNTATPNIEFSKIALLEGHTDKILSSSVIPFSRDIITTGADGKALLWKPKF